MRDLKTQSKQEIQQKAQEINDIYTSYLFQLNELKKQQTEIVNQFIKEIEQKKIEEIKKAIKII